METIQKENENYNQYLINAHKETGSLDKDILKAELKKQELLFIRFQH